jgi:hypothetical protein
MSASDHGYSIHTRSSERAPGVRTTSVLGRVGRGRSILRVALVEHAGQALVEFALILPIVLVVLLGIGWFGLALNTENDETHLANEVARYAIVNENPGGGTEQLQNWAQKQGDSNFLKTSGKVCISFPEGAEAGKPVKVEATSTIGWLPLLKLKPASTTLHGTAYMRLETAPSNYKAGCST